MIYGLRDPEDKIAGRIGGMWVKPSYRAMGLGRDLLAALLSWGTKQRLDLMALWVSKENFPALELYRKSGFICKARTGLLRNGSKIQTVEMVRSLPI